MEISGLIEKNKKNRKLSIFTKPENVRRYREMTDEDRILERKCDDTDPIWLDETPPNAKILDDDWFKIFVLGKREREESDLTDEDTLRYRLQLCTDYF